MTTESSSPLLIIFCVWDKVYGESEVNAAGGNGSGKGQAWGHGQKQGQRRGLGGRCQMGCRLLLLLPSMLLYMVVVRRPCYPKPRPTHVTHALVSFSQTRLLDLLLAAILDLLFSLAWILHHHHYIRRMPASRRSVSLVNFQAHNSRRLRLYEFTWTGTVSSRTHLHLHLSVSLSLSINPPLRQSPWCTDQYTFVQAVYLPCSYCALESTPIPRSIANIFTSLLIARGV